MSQRHDNLVAWQRADKLCVAVYMLTAQHFPKTERFGLTSQLRRASYSVAANIVEGYAFESDRTKLRHLRIAAASLAELGYGMHLATQLRYLPAKDADLITRSIRQTGAPLHGLIREVKQKAATRPPGS
jgi:four helix bundle protein